MTLTSQIYEAVKGLREQRTPKMWYASQIAKCPRALYFERLGVPPLPENEPGAGKILRWSAGHHLEASLRPYLETIYPNLLTNIKFTNEELDLVGEFDGYDPDSKTLISVKSVHDYAMITRDGVVGLKEKVGTKISPRTGKEVDDYDLKKEPYTHHQWQEHAYKLLLGHLATKVKENGLGLHTEDSPYVPMKEPLPVERIVYVYVTLGGLLTTFTTPTSDLIEKRVADKLKYLNGCLESSTTPICQCGEGQEFYKETNQYCNFKTSGGCCNVKLLETIKEKSDVKA